jgi:hypothetical protein
MLATGRAGKALALVIGLAAVLLTALPAYAAVWVPPHYGPRGWVPGHWAHGRGGPPPAVVVVPRAPHRVWVAPRPGPYGRVIPGYYVVR